MSRLSRRTVLGSTLAGAAALPMGAAGPRSGFETPARRPAPPNGAGLIQLSEIFSAGDDARMKLASQIGIRHAIAGMALNRFPRSQYLEKVQEIQEKFKANGLEIVGVESHPVAAEKIKLGLDGRDEEIENYIAAIQALSKAGIRMVCYNFMAGLGWYRTKVNLAERGGALTSEFDLPTAEAQGLTQWGEVPEEKMWANIEYFQKAVIPVAQSAGVNMALHPDDPPLPKLRGISRIVTSARNYRRIMNIVPSPVNGVTFCQANFVLMGEDIAKLIREWGPAKKIFFAHYRDVEGTAEHFRETFHDNGPIDMAKMIQIYYQAGFRGPVRPDHAPTLANEANDRPGYAMNGKVFAIGYMKGALDAYGIPYA